MDNSLRVGMLIFCASFVVAKINMAMAGPFLDLDIGTHLQSWPDQTYNGEPALGQENPIGIIRIGYQTNKWNFAGPLNVRAHAYYEHMSSAGTNMDSGVDVLMFGVRFE